MRFQIVITTKNYIQYFWNCDWTFCFQSQLQIVSRLQRFKRIDTRVLNELRQIMIFMKLAIACFFNLQRFEENHMYNPLERNEFIKKKLKNSYNHLTLTCFQDDTGRRKWLICTWRWMKEMLTQWLSMGWTKLLVSFKRFIRKQSVSRAFAANVFQNLL